MTAIFMATEVWLDKVRWDCLEVGIGHLNVVKQELR